MKSIEIDQPSLNNCFFVRPRRISVVMIILLCLLLCGGAYAMAREKPLDKVFNAADTDGNGMISKTEWHAAMQKRLEATDTNGDGNISREEFKKARETFRDKLRNRSMP